MGGTLSLQHHQAEGRCHNVGVREVCVDFDAGMAHLERKRMQEHRRTIPGAHWNCLGSRRRGRGYNECLIGGGEGSGCEGGIGDDTSTAVVQCRGNNGR